MDAKLFDIVGRLKQNEMFYSTPSDFALGDAWAVSPRIVIDEPGWSPYCIDHQNGIVAFTRLPPDVDLALAPFLYVTQYREADRLLVLPIAALPELTADLPDPEAIFVFSMGRCGTTLVSHALNGSPTVWSLSEPDVFNHRALQVPADGPVPAGDLVRGLMRLLYAQRFRHSAKSLAVKFRSQSLYHLAPFASGRPDARFIFMYRDALSWAHSILQFLTDVDFPLRMDDEERIRGWNFFSGDGPLGSLGHYVDLSASTIDIDVMTAAGWMAHLEAYLAHLEFGVPFLAMRYNELVADRRGELERLFDHCRLHPAGLIRALTAFDEDSQKGTAIGRRDTRARFNDASIANIKATLAKDRRFADPNLILPDIYSRVS